MPYILSKHFFFLFFLLCLSWQRAVVTIYWLVVDGGVHRIGTKTHTFSIGVKCLLAFGMYWGGMKDKTLGGSASEQKYLSKNERRKKSPK